MMIMLMLVMAIKRVIVLLPHHPVQGPLLFALVEAIIIVETIIIGETIIIVVCSRSIETIIVEAR